MASAAPDTTCSRCNCMNDGKPCYSCVFYKFRCLGTCPCCEKHRKTVYKTEPSASSSAKSQESTCSRCNCKKDGVICDICIHFKFRCIGNCSCCEEYRKLISKKSTSASPSTELNAPRYTCSYCECPIHMECCSICVRGRFKCPGTCQCCAHYRRNQRILRDEKFVDKVLRKKVIPSAPNEANKITFIPPEMLNNLTRGNLQQTSTARWINSTVPPSIPEPVSEGKKEQKRLLCSQCFCEGDVIPCNICIVKDSRCRGPCPCCAVKDQQALLNAQSLPEFEQVCPQCVCKPGDGWCDFCIKISKARTTAVIPTDQNLPSTSGTKGPKKKNVSKAAVRAKSSAHTAELRAKKVSKRAPCPDASPSKRMRTTPTRRPKIEQYCLNCDCVYGKEPCNFCKDDFNCYGTCRCCSAFNMRLLTANTCISELYTGEQETLDEIPDVGVKVIVSVGPPSISAARCLSAN